MIKGKNNNPHDSVIGVNIYETNTLKTKKW
jgi:hypothetical protein